MAPSSDEATAAPSPLHKNFEQMYTRWVIDPLAEPTARWLAKFSFINPNRVTAASGLVGLAAAACFIIGLLPAAGVLFLLRFFIDCLDGKIARAQHRTSNRGAALDLMMDIPGILLCFAALSWHLVARHEFSPIVAMALLVFVGLFNWALQFRKQLAERAGIGTGGTNRSWRSSRPVIGAYSRWCARKEMNPLPYAVEMETLALGLLPLLGWPAATAAGLHLAATFYLLASAVNVRRVWRIAALLDSPIAIQRTQTRENES